jgi:hypothetical protein
VDYHREVLDLGPQKMGKGVLAVNMQVGQKDLVVKLSVELIFDKKGLAL